MSTALELLRRLDIAGVDVDLNPAGGLHLSGQRPPADLLEEVRVHRDALIDLLQSRRKPPAGADLIPRAPVDDPRYAGVDLAARGVDVDVLSTGIARLDMAPDDLPDDMRAVAERIARELQTASPDDIGRYATDVLYAYGDVPNISPAVEAAMFHAWALSAIPTTCQRVKECGRTGPCTGHQTRRQCNPAEHNTSETKPIQKRYTTESEAA